MKKMTLFSELEQLLGKENVKRNEPLSGHTTFRIGGPCRAFVTPEGKEAFLQAVRLLKERREPFFVLGRGSNLLVSDHGFGGVVLSLREHVKSVSVSGTVITAEGGALLFDVAKAALNADLTGMEFASGIPGTVGGGLVMNAGAYGSDLSQSVVSAEILLPDGTVRTFTKDELELSYRHSVLQENHGTVLSAEFHLTPGDPEAIRALTEELNGRRREKQPLEFPSAGSTFKRPEGYFAGKLIEEAGLKGVRVGDAEVSEKHAGFIINRGHATAADVDGLIRLVIRKVRENSGVILEPEVIYLGEF